MLEHENIYHDDHYDILESKREVAEGAVCNDAGPCEFCKAIDAKVDYFELFTVQDFMRLSGSSGL